MWNVIKAWFANLGQYCLSHVLPALGLLVVGLLLIRGVMQLVSKGLEKSRLEKAAHTLIKSVLRISMYVLLLLTVASSMGIDVTGVVALASVLTLAISLAMQNALTNVVGGVTLLSNNSISAGDFVEIAGQSGTVMEVGLTYTMLATSDNKTVYIPNSSVVAEQIVNYSVAGTRRVDVKVSAGYESPVEEVLEALRQAGQVPTILPEPAPFAAVTGYGDNAIEYVLRVWCKSGDYWTTLCEVNKNVKVCFDKNKIVMTYPHLNVHFDKQM